MNNAHDNAATDRDILRRLTCRFPRCAELVTCANEDVCADHCQCHDGCPQCGGLDQCNCLDIRGEDGEPDWPPRRGE